LGLSQFIKYKAIPAVQLILILSVLVAAFYSIVFGGYESLPSCRTILRLGDLNADGAFTIKDIWPNVLEIYNFPYTYVAQHGALVAVDNFFEVTDLGCRSWSSRIINIFIWAIIIFVVSLANRAAIFCWIYMIRESTKTSSEIINSQARFSAKRIARYFDFDVWPILWLALANSISIQSVEVRRIIFGHPIDRAPTADFSRPKNKENLHNMHTPKRSLEKSGQSLGPTSEANSADPHLTEGGDQNPIPKEYSSGF